jgi:O-antigen/teichoic acid export membrane protein
MHETHEIKGTKPLTSTPRNKVLGARFAALASHIRTPLYRNGYLLILSTVTTSVLGFVFWALAARLYPEQNVGLNSAALSIMIFLAGIAQLNLQELMIRYIPLAGWRTTRFVLYSYCAILLFSIAVGVIFCAAISFWSPSLSFITEQPVLTLWFIAAVSIWCVFVVEDAVLTGLQQTTWVPVENAAFSTLKIVLLVIFATTIPATGIFISWTASAFLVIVPVNYLLFRNLIPQHEKAAPQQEVLIPVRQLVVYVVANYVAALLVNVSTALLPLIITHVAGAVANAHFYLTWVVASSLQIIASNMATSLTVEGAINDKELASYKRRVIVNIYRLLLPIVIVIVIAAPLLLKLFGDNYAEQGTQLLQLLALSSLANAINIVYVALARIKNRIRTIIFIYGANAVLVLGLSYYLLTRIGLAGVGIAWLVSQTLIAMLLLGRDFVANRGL